MRSATFQPTIPSVAWPVDQPEIHIASPLASTSVKTKPVDTTHLSTSRAAKQNSMDEFGLNEEDDLALMQLAEITNVEGVSQNFEDIDTAFTRTRMQSNTQRPGKLLGQRDQVLSEPALLPNGRYRCQHRCKDKRKCSHKCCQDGMDHPPREPKQSSTQPGKSQPSRSNSIISKIQPARQGGVDDPLRRHNSGIGELDLTAESFNVRDKAPAARALQQLRAKAIKTNQQAIAQGRTHDVQNMENQDNFQLPNFDDEELDKILDSDAKSGYMLADENLQPPEPLEVLSSDGPFPELSTILDKRNNGNYRSATVKDVRQITTGEYDDYDFDTDVNWDTVDVPVYENNGNDLEMALDQGIDDNNNEAYSRMSCFTAPLAAAIPTASNYRKRPSADPSTNTIPVVRSSVKKFSALQEMDSNIFSPSKRFKSTVSAEQETVNKVTQSTFTLVDEKTADEKKEELEAWFNSEFGHCAVLVDIVE
jgi:hypothetical protein